MGRINVNPRLNYKDTCDMYVINSWQKKIDPVFRFTIDTTEAGSASDTFVLPIALVTDVEVEWGDGLSDNYTTAGDKTHVYASPGVYQISITGTAGQIISFNATGDRLKLLSIQNWGDLGWTSMYTAFRSCTNLVTIPQSEITGAEEVASMHNAFRGTGISELPKKMLWLMPNIGEIHTCFWDTKITTIPTEFFKESTLITNFAETFGGNINLTNIPSDLFSYCLNVTNFQYTFRFNTSLTSLPNNLFINNPLVTNYLGTFEGCRNLAISNLFDLSALFRVTTFRDTFQNTLTSYSNTGTVQDIWAYATNSSLIKTNCFLNNTALNNYADIPNDWKGL